MATKYTLYFSDTDKTPFDLQSYTTNGPKSPSDPSPIAGSNGNIETTLKLYGRGNKDYGEAIFQDLIYMLENFTNPSRPVFSIEGQLWYNNKVITGSPPILPELFIRNANIDDAYGGSPFTALGWDAVILATGSSAMTGELILFDNPTNALGAAPKQYVDLHAASIDLHLSVDQNTFLDALSLPTLLALEVDQLIGINTGSTVQTQLNGKVNISGSAMTSGANLTFIGGGEVLGLPIVPSVDDAAASKKYVLDQVAETVVGDGVLSNTQWLNTGLGSPLPVITETTLRLTVTQPGSPPTEITFDALGIARIGHTHTAIDTSIDNSFDGTYGTNVQTAIETAATEIDLLKTGGIPPSATITVQRIFESLTSPLTVAGSPIDTFEIQNHFADDNRVLLTINGVKQYAHSRGTQSIIYSVGIGSFAATGLDAGQTYDFNIAVDGAAPTTISINAGSPAIDISTHGALVTAINTQLSASPVLGAEFSINSSSTEIFTSHTAGVGSSIEITDPAGSPNLYLFALTGSPVNLDNLIEVATAIDGIDGEYAETNSNGITVLPNAPTSYVVFNYGIIIGSKIESLLYV